MPEFEEIGSAGGKIELIVNDSQDAVSLRLSGSGGPMSAFQLGVSLDGEIIEGVNPSRVSAISWFVFHWVRSL